MDYEKSEPCQDKSPTLWPVTTFWTVRDVSRFICDSGYPQYAKHFSDNAINGKDLMSMNAFDLQRLGIGNMVDAMCVNEVIRKAATSVMCNFEDFDKPPNISYDSGFKARSLLPGETRLPLPPENPRDLCLPYRDNGAHMYRYNLPVQAYHDHSMVMGRTDAWKMYNSKF